MEVSKPSPAEGLLNPEKRFRVSDIDAWFAQAKQQSEQFQASIPPPTPVINEP